MNDTSKTFYKVGNVFNIIKIVLSIIFSGLFFLARAHTDADVTYDFNKDMYDNDFEDWLSVSELKSLLLTLAIFFIIFAVLLVVIHVFAKKAKKDLDSTNPKNNLHIVVIVLGIFTNSLFYILGAIFGIVFSVRHNNKNEISTE